MRQSPFHEVTNCGRQPVLVGCATGIVQGSEKLVPQKRLISGERVPLVRAHRAEVLDHSQRVFLLGFGRILLSTRLAGWGFVPTRDQGYTRSH